jgi:hypothetical protein
MHCPEYLTISVARSAAVQGAVCHTPVTMGNDADRKTIMDRADRMLRQSRTLRKMSEELRKESTDLKKESADLRRSVARENSARKSPKKRRR